MLFLLLGCASKSVFTLPSVDVVIRAHDAELIQADAELHCSCTVNHTPLSLERILKHTSTGVSGRVVAQTHVAAEPGQWRIQAATQDFGDPLRTRDHRHGTTCAPTLQLLFARPADPSARAAVSVPLPTSSPTLTVTGRPDASRFTVEVAGAADVTAGPTTW